MQIRPYPEKQGKRSWLSRHDQDKLLDVPEDEYPRRRIAFEMGLCGLRSDEIRQVRFKDFRSLDDQEDRWVMIVPDGKTGRRSVPIDEDLYKRIRFLKSASRKNRNDTVIDIATRTMRSWMKQHREEIAEETGDDNWLTVTMHDLRRTFATDTFYSLAFEGVPIAEELTKSFGGWKMTATGRETFRSAYLGPIPDHITRQAAEKMDL